MSLSAGGLRRSATRAPVGCHTAEDRAESLRPIQPYPNCWWHQSAKLQGLGAEPQDSSSSLFPLALLSDSQAAMRQKLPTRLGEEPKKTQAILHQLHMHPLAVVGRRNPGGPHSFTVTGLATRRIGSRTSIKMLRLSMMILASNCRPARRGSGPAGPGSSARSSLIQI
jgi:hypothetical protein